MDIYLLLDAGIECLQVLVIFTQQANMAKQYSTSEYGKAIRQAAIRAKIEPWSPNQLRKYAAQKLLEEQGIEAASALLGHSCVDITRKHYTNQAENKAKLAALYLERLLD